jgi:hypothetical protein
MERSNEFLNQTMQTKIYIIYINDEIEVNQGKRKSKSAN